MGLRWCTLLTCPPHSQLCLATLTHCPIRLPSSLPLGVAVPPTPSHKHLGVTQEAPFLTTLGTFQRVPFCASPSPTTVTLLTSCLHCHVGLLLPLSGRLLAQASPLLSTFPQHPPSTHTSIHDVPTGRELTQTLAPWPMVLSIPISQQAPGGPRVPMLSWWEASGQSWPVGADSSQALLGLSCHREEGLADPGEVPESLLSAGTWAMQRTDARSPSTPALGPLLGLD